MSPLEANVLLTEAALMDPRVVPDPDRAELWAEVLDGVSLVDARRALRQFWRSSPGVYPQPGHLLEQLDVLVQDQWASLPDVTAEVVDLDRARQLRAAGVTEAEWLANGRDPEWIRCHFPWASSPALPAAVNERGEVES